MLVFGAGIIQEFHDELRHGQGKREFEMPNKNKAIDIAIYNAVIRRVWIKAKIPFVVLLYVVAPLPFKPHPHPAQSDHSLCSSGSLKFSEGQRFILVIKTITVQKLTKLLANVTLKFLSWNMANTLIFLLKKNVSSFCIPDRARHDPVGLTGP